MYLGAFDIGGTKTIVALADETGSIFEKQQFSTNTGDCFQHLDMCCDIFQGFVQKRGICMEQISGIGVNLPGIVDQKTGILLRAVYARWNNIPVRDYICKRLNISRVVCENDVNSCAVGELHFGLGKQYNNFGWMTVSTGVGGAVVSQGQLLRGTHGFAGEFGHLKVEYHNPSLCPCGEQGCLEAHGSGTALNRMISERIASDLSFRAAFEQLGDAPSGASCAQLARNGNQAAAELFQQVGEYLGRGIAYYVNILDPDAMIIGGGVSASLDLLMPGIRKATDQYVFAPMKDVLILPTALGYEAALMGAIAIVL